jgi:hypothetical protein
MEASTLTPAQVADAKRRAKEKELPRGQALWRLNERGLLELRAEPGKPLDRTSANAKLDEALDKGWWKPKARRKRPPLPQSDTTPARLREWSEKRHKGAHQHAKGNETA